MENCKVCQKSIGKGMESRYNDHQPLYLELGFGVRLKNKEKDY